MSEPDNSNPKSSRWSGFVERSTDPIFILNRSRRILFVNPAWETLTGLKLAEVRGWVCKRRPGEASPGSAEAVLQALAPPTDALAGKTARVRRRFLKSASAVQWWDIEFFPMAGPEGVAGIIGKIAVVPQPSPVAIPLPERIVALRQEVVEWYRLDTMSSQVSGVERMLEQIRHAAKTLLPVTLLGEAGAGRHWAARALHYQANPEAPFARIDCTTLNASAASELLGEGGMLTRLGIGTVYLREPSHLPRELQARLRARIASEENTTPRIVVSFAGDPQDEVRAGRLLEDFYCGVSTIAVQVPPLRARLADLPWFVGHFLSRLAEGPREVSSEAMDILRSSSWRGNLRELCDVLRSASGRAKTGRIEVADLPFYLRATPTPTERSLPLDSILEQVEKRLMLLALRLSQNNKTKAAEMLGVWRTRLVRRLEAFGMPPEAEES